MPVSSYHALVPFVFGQLHLVRCVSFLVKCIQALDSRVGDVIWIELKLDAAQCPFTVGSN